MHAAMSRIVATAVLVIASTFVPPSAYAVIQCEPPPTFVDSNGVVHETALAKYVYCCQFKDTSGPTTGFFKLARCQYPCGSFTNYCISRRYCNDVAHGINCAPTDPCGSLCSQHKFTVDGILKLSPGQVMCGFPGQCGTF